jgi:hypothetical protein
MNWQQKQAATRQLMIELFGPESEVGSSAWKARRDQILSDQIARADIELMRRAQALKEGFKKFRISHKESRPDGKLD